MVLSWDPSRLFGLDIKGRDCGDEAAQWFTNFLKTEAFRLVQFEKNMKGRSSRDIFPPFVQNYQVSLQRAAFASISHSSLSGFLLGPQRAALGTQLGKCSDGPGEWY